MIYAARVAHTIRYSVTRGEIWRWYWRAWAQPRGLWRLHVLLAVSIGIAAATPGLRSFDPAVFLRTAALVGLAAVSFLPLWPQFRFKPQERLLAVDERGWTTRIGELSGGATWPEIRSIEALADSVVITGKNGNALVIPLRAFPDASARQQFVADAVRWRSEATRIARG